MKLAFLFRTAPHGNAISREGLDALLAATAFCDEEEIGVFFIDDGVLNLLDGQNPELLLQKDFIRTFKLLDLYDIEQRFVCLAKPKKCLRFKEYYALYLFSSSLF
ncbi:MAG: sulfurtransferase complex subunit TusC [Haemophilus parainfluenzae]|nr:sulfurtransferase complex subunit TusC [Haemophilus parainfluenzae]